MFTFYAVISLLSVYHSKHPLIKIFSTKEGFKWLNLILIRDLGKDKG